MSGTLPSAKLSCGVGGKKTGKRKRCNKPGNSQTTAQGGTTSWSVKGIANQCGLGKATVIKALKKLLDAGFIQYAGHAWGNGSPKRRWRVTHPKHLEAVRYAISVMGLPSLKYHEPTTNDKAEAQEGEAWEADPSIQDMGSPEFERDQERLERDFSCMGGNAI